MFAFLILSALLSLTLGGCSKQHLTGRYICALDVFDFSADDTFVISDAKTGANAMKGRYKIGHNEIDLIPEKGYTLHGKIEGDSIVVKGLPPLVKERK